MIKTRIVNGEKVFAAAVFDSDNEIKCAIRLIEEDNDILKASATFFNTMAALAEPAIKIERSYTAVSASEALVDIYLESSLALDEYVEHTCFGKDVKRQQHKVFDVLTNALYDVLYAN